MSRRNKVLLGALGTVVVLGVAGWLALPGFVTDKLRERAAAQGVTLTVGDMELGLHTIVLRDVDATMPSAPGQHAAAGTVSVEHDWLDVKSVSVSEARVDLTGDPLTLAHRLAPSGPAGSPAATASATRPPLHVTGKVAWVDALGAGTRVDCPALTLDAPGGATPDALTATCAGWTLTKGALVFGPWSGAARHSASGDSLALALSDGAKIDLSSISGALTVDLKVTGQDPRKLGLPAAALGSLPSPAALDLALHYEETSAGAVKGSLDLGSDAMPLGGARVMPLQLRTRFSGTKTGTLDVTSDVANVGPFKGALTGTISPPKQRADLSFTSAVVSCREATATLATQAFGPLGQQLGGLLHAVGADQGVQGTVSLRADLSLDLAHPDASQVTTKTEGDCALQLGR